MDSYNILLDKLEDIRKSISSMCLTAENIGGAANNYFAEWKQTCRIIANQISEDVVRVAVVGPIKSGKSTFVNSLFKTDFLKRGAGIITSIVTRIHQGHTLEADLFFKSWDEINSEIKQALVLFPAKNGEMLNNSFDIRRAKDRKSLAEGLDLLEPEQLISENSLNLNSLLLSSYLKGYEQVKDLVASENTTITYLADRFQEQRRFVADDNLAIYLKDISLQISGAEFERNIEIADCQGSDSPNPRHLTMVQNYLIKTHLIIYVISSRTGLRQADIRFLSMIKKMGIMDNIFFIINFDFSEHESLDELKKLVEKIQGELAIIKPEPQIYIFSSLYNLFACKPQKISSKDQARLEQWQNEKSLMSYSDRETHRFQKDFNHKLTTERTALLVSNHLERLWLIAKGLENWVGIYQDFLNKDVASACKLSDKINQQQVHLDQVKSMIKSTLDGSIQKLNQKLKNEVDNFFDIPSGEIPKKTISFVQNYNLPLDNYFEQLRNLGFNQTLYSIFQEFKQAVEFFITQSINPELIRFIKKCEGLISAHMKAVAVPYDSMIVDALSSYYLKMKDSGVKLIAPGSDNSQSINLDYIKELTGLVAPPINNGMRYTAYIKTEAVFHFGFYKILKLFKKILKKPEDGEFESEVQALKNGIKRIKQESVKSLNFHFKDYRENIKFQYLFKLTDIAGSNLYQLLLDRFQGYQTDFTNMTEIIDQNQDKKEKTARELDKLTEHFISLNQRINSLRENIFT